MIKNRIRKYRNDQNMSQEQLSDAMNGKHGQTILSLIENGHVLPTKETMNDLCKALNCRPTDLYDASDLSFFDPDNPVDHNVKIVSVVTSHEFDSALKELGYSDIQEWVNESRRNLLKDLYIKRMNQHIHLVME